MLRLSEEAKGWDARMGEGRGSTAGKKGERHIHDTHEKHARRQVHVVTGQMRVPLVNSCRGLHLWPSTSRVMTALDGKPKLTSKRLAGTVQTTNSTQHACWEHDTGRAVRGGGDDARCE